MKNDYFRQIVSTRFYEGRVKNKVKIDVGPQFRPRDGAKRPQRFIVKEITRTLKWQNTNLMLNQPGYNGLKTGVTEAAGPCLSASYQKDGQYFIVTILHSKSMDDRWDEVQALVDWAVS